VQQRTETLVAEHDRIAETLTALVRDLAALDAGGELAIWRASLARFEELYATHAKSETAFLEGVAASLSNDPEAAEQLRVLLDET
jgi:hypothetical protein